jgi:hypothetical protein
VPAVSPTRPRRFWPRFTLRVLLVFVTLVGVGLGYWTHRARDQRRIVERIEQGGGMVCYERDGPDAPDPRNFAVEWLAKVLNRDYLERVVSATIDDRKVLRDARHLTGLESLQIDDAELTDDDLTVLVHYSELRVLRICPADPFAEVNAGSQISDISLRRIARLPKLEVADLYGAGFWREGIQSLNSSLTLRKLTVGPFEESVIATDFSPLKRAGRIQSFWAWRKKGATGFETIHW